MRPTRSHLGRSALLTGSIAVLIVAVLFININMKVVNAATPDEASASVYDNWPNSGYNAAGTRFNNKETTLSASNVSTLIKAWATPFPGVFDSSAVVVGATAYMTNSNQLYALNTKSGKVRWSHVVNVNSSSLATPAVANGVVYIGSEDAEGRLYAFQASTGSLLWKSNTTFGGVLVGSPTVANGVVYVGSQLSALYAFDASNGAILWQGTTSGPTYTATVVNGMVYVNGYFGNVFAFNAAGCGSATCSPVWTATAGSYSGGSAPSVANGIVYAGFFDKKVYALSATTGATIWTFTTGNFVRSSAAIANGIVYIGSDDGNLYALKAKTGKLVWSASTGNNVSSSPAVANGVAYVGSENGYLFAFNALTGVQLWSADAGHSSLNPVVSSPTVASGAVYVGSYDRNFYAFKLP